jgi:hypothetical protein
MFRKMPNKALRDEQREMAKDQTATPTTRRQEALAQA